MNAWPALNGLLETLVAVGGGGVEVVEVLEVVRVVPVAWPGMHW